MPGDLDGEESGPVEVKIVDGHAGSSEPRQRRVWYDVFLVVLSVVLSGALAFGVAHYTVSHDNAAQERAANQKRLSAAYIPLSSALARVIACVSPDLCSEAELSSADRAANAAIVEVLAQGSNAVADRVSVLETTLRTIVEDRRRGLRAGTAIAGRAARQFNALKTQISKELEY